MKKIHSAYISLILGVVTLLGLGITVGVALHRSPPPPEATPTATIPIVKPPLETPKPTYEDKINYLDFQDLFDLPLQGATAFASIPLNMREQPNGELVTIVPHGEGFVILAEQEGWWRVQYQEFQGFVYANYCLINLPDVLPSAVYWNTNAQSSVFRSSFYDIPEVTGEKLYDAYEYNPRLGKEEFTMVVLYQTALKIAAVQRAAFQQGETLVINELYRPAETQKRVLEQLTALSHANEEVYAGLHTPPWSIGWFIKTDVSNHQRGYAIDTSLARILQTEKRASGDYVYEVVTQYQEYDMPTPIHELSLYSARLGYSSLTDTKEDEMEEGSTQEGSSERSSLLYEDVFARYDDEMTPSFPFAEAMAETRRRDNMQKQIDAIMESQNPSFSEEDEMESLKDALESSPEPTPEPVFGRSPAMTEGTDRLLAYFEDVGMSPIDSEWWHFNDFDNGGLEENRGDYFIQGIHSVPPYGFQALPEDVTESKEEGENT